MADVHRREGQLARPRSLVALWIVATAATLACVAPSAPAQAPGDQAYAEDAEARAHALMHGRSFAPAAPVTLTHEHPALNCGGNRARCARVLDLLQRGTFRVVAPYQSSASDPDLPDAVQFAARCPDFHFARESPRPGVATRTFSLYRLAPADAPHARIDRFVHRTVDFRTAGTPGETWYSSFLDWFHPATCELLGARQLAIEGYRPQHVFNEIVFIDGEFAILYLYPFDRIGERLAYDMLIELIGRRGAVLTGTFAYRETVAGGQR